MAKIITDINEAAQVLAAEEVIGFPTETVYGLAGNIYSTKAIEKIFSIKQRPKFNPLIVHIGNKEAINDIAIDIPDIAYTLMDKCWPGPLTLLLKKKDSIPNIITAGSDMVAVRMPQHTMALALLNAIDFPLAAPSANPFMRISPTTAEQVAAYFPNELKLVLDGGNCTKGIESTIVGFPVAVPTLYRYGAIAVEDIEAITGKLLLKNKDDKQPATPGMLLKHYSPVKPIILVEDIGQAITQYHQVNIAVLSFSKSFSANNIVYQETLSTHENIAEAAYHFYSALQRMDQSNAQLIIAERMPDIGLGKTINDRLERAAK